MLFIEKFNYNPRQDNFPSIYIRDLKTGLSYELEDLAEVKDGSLLLLNVDEMAFENLQKQLTIGFTAVNKDIGELRKMFAENTEVLKQQISSSPKPTATLFRNLTRKVMATRPPDDKDWPADTAPEKRVSSELVADIKTQFEEVQALRRDVSIMRQLCKDFQGETATLLQELTDKASSLKKNAPTQVQTARAAIDAGKAKLEKQADSLTLRVEDLQDIIDELKADVTQRKCRPSETRMVYVAAEAEALRTEIEDMSKYIKRVKPTWKKTWEDELQNIVKEQQFLKEHENLLLDLEEDHAALSEVYQQLQQIIQLQAKSKPKPFEFNVTPEEGFEGMSSVLKEVQTIDVDHDRRLRALSQAEKMREQELANRIDDFELELNNFVSSKRLKKTGGAEEAERLRRKKDEALLKSLFKPS
jgi:hypothetical protein